MKPEYLYVSFMVGFLCLQSLIFGLNDIFTFVLILISTMMLFYTINKFHISSREILRNHTEKGSKLYKLLSGNSFLTIVIASIISFITSIILIVVLKGIYLNHGFIIMLLVIALGSISVIWITKKRGFSKLKIIKDNLNSDIEEHISRFILLFYLVVGFLFIVTITLTMFDYNEFISNTITFQNFQSEAYKNSIELNENNLWTGAIINASLLMDSFKMAFTNFVFELLKMEKGNSFLLSIAIIGCLNFIKFLGFSFAFVYLQATIIELINKFYKKENIVFENIKGENNEK